MGSALTSKVLKANCQFVCGTTVQLLNDDELQSPVIKRDAMTLTHFGKAATSADAYFDDTHIIDPDNGDAEITPKMGNNYLTV
jgi:hypothetical protein